MPFVKKEQQGTCPWVVPFVCPGTEGWGRGGGVTPSNLTLLYRYVPPNTVMFLGLRSRTGYDIQAVFCVILQMQEIFNISSAMLTIERGIKKCPSFSRFFFFFFFLNGTSFRLQAHSTRGSTFGGLDGTYPSKTYKFYLDWLGWINPGRPR